MRRFLSYQDIRGSKTLAELGGGPPLLVGRDARCHIQFNDPTLSSEHCRIFHEDAGSFVEDLGSTNGTFVNERRVPIRQRQELKPDDLIRCGRLQLQLVVAVQADAVTQTGVRTPAVPPILRRSEQLEGNEEATRLTVQHVELKTSLAESRRELELQQRLCSKTKEELQRALQCLRILQGEREQLQRECATRQQELLDARAEARELNLCLEAARQQSTQAATHWQQLVNKAELAAARADKERHQVLSQSTELAEECSSMKGVISTQEQQITSLQSELNVARRRLDDLLTTLDRTERQLADLRTHSQEARRKAELRCQQAQAEAQQLRQEAERLRRLTQL